jgi:hypothetical protein
MGLGSSLRVVGLCVVDSLLCTGVSRITMRLPLEVLLLICCEILCDYLLYYSIVFPRQGSVLSEDTFHELLRDT